jgi:hypothetical protein
VYKGASMLLQQLGIHLSHWQDHCIAQACIAHHKPCCERQAADVQSRPAQGMQVSV